MIENDEYNKIIKSIMSALPKNRVSDFMDDHIKKTAEEGELFMIPTFGDNDDTTHKPFRIVLVNSVYEIASIDFKKEILRRFTSHKTKTEYFKQDIAEMVVSLREFADELEGKLSEK